MIASNKPVRDKEIASVVESAKLNDLDGKEATRLVKCCWVFIFNEWSESAQATAGCFIEDDLKVGIQQGTCTRKPTTIATYFSTSLLHTQITLCMYHTLSMV